MWPNKWFINSNKRIARQYITKSFNFTNTKIRFIQFILNMLFKSKLFIKNWTQVLLRICTRNFNIVVKDSRMGFFIFFPGENYFMRRFLGSGLKSIFHWYAHYEITLRSRFKCLADSLGSWTIEKREVSSANNLAIEFSPSGRLLIYIKNNRGPRMDPCGTPALIGRQLDSCPFNNTLWNLLQR